MRQHTTAPTRDGRTQSSTGATDGGATVEHGSGQTAPDTHRESTTGAGTDAPTPTAGAAVDDPASAVGGAAATRRRFEVRVENVARDDTDGTGRLPATLTPGAFAVHSRPRVLFEVGRSASPGLAALARDGRPGELAEELRADDRVAAAGTFGASNVGADSAPDRLAPGESARFTVEAAPGARLSLATTVGRSVDAVYAPTGGGIDLFRGAGPVTGDATDQFAAWAVGPDRAPGRAGADLAPDCVVPALFGFGWPGVAETLRVSVRPLGGGE
jgi:hypothetical protein